MNITHREPDTITSEDLPTLRANLLNYLNDATLSDQLRSACQKAIAAIDQARDDDETTHAPLEVSLNAFVSAGNEEMQRFRNLSFLCNRIAKSTNAETLRGALVEMIPMLSEWQVTVLSVALADALMGDAGPAFQFDLADMLAASNQLH